MTFRPSFALIALAAVAAGCVPTPTQDLIPGTPAVIGGDPAGGSGATQPTPPAELGTPEFPAPRAVPSRAGELKGTVKGPKLGLIASYGASVIDKPTEGLLASAAGYRLQDVTEQYQALAGVKVAITDDKGNPFSEEVKSDDQAAFSFRGFLPQTSLLFVKASYAEADQDVTLLAAARFPQKAETLELAITPASTLVAKKAIEMVRLGGIPGEQVPPSMLTRMAAEIEASMTTRAVVAAAILPDGKAADAFDTMVKNSETLKSKLSAIASESSATKFLDKTPVSTTNLYGKVYDVTGQLLSVPAKVKVKSLNAARPFDKTFDVQNGQYTATEVPSESILEITVFKDGWTTRKRVETLQPTGQARVDFGGAEDPSGAAYFIANQPEIVEVEPEDGAFLENSQLAYKLILSEPLDAANRQNFEASLRVIPASNGADSNPADEYPPAAIADLAFSDLLLTKLPYTVDKDSAFLGSDAVKTSFAWDEAGKACTLTFNAPLITSKEETATYNVGLFNMGVAIKDAEGNRLGTDKTGSFTSTPETYGVWCGTFKDANLALASLGSSTGSRWLGTHHLASSFSYAKDETIPQLQSVAVKKETDFTRLELTFNEPMGAYAGASFSKNNILPQPSTYINYSLRNITFAVAESVADLAAVPLDGADALLMPASEAAFVEEKWATEVYFGVSKLSQAVMSIDPANPAIVRLDLKQDESTPFRFPANLKAIKIRVGSNIQNVNIVADPAGNMIDDGTANANILTGSL